ncbi:hypothetical protein MNBD_GAMMA21-2262 [hydrothermal vent metagenome]|uniref:Uncharacterized protein n=1 Tax=hydrothermal vent metagenome TaxID=652676 RepID=A0A3B0ZP37_9ZZZZ
MNHNEFVIGQEFKCAERRWRCTDIGCRVIVAIPVDYAEISTFSENKTQKERRVLTEKDLSGPPYWLAESVFDEDDIISCELLTQTD